MNKIIIIGGTGTALNIAEGIKDAIINFKYPAEIIGFANDMDYDDIGGFPIISKIKNISNFFVYDDVKFIYALYKPEVMSERSLLLQNLNIPKTKFTNFIHPSSYISSSLVIGNGNVVLQNCTIQNKCKIGNNNIISSNVVVEHDSCIGNSNFIAAGVVIGSNVQIESSNFIGLNSSIRENIVIKNNSFLGMGSVLVNNTNENEVLYGVPAKKR